MPQKPKGGSIITIHQRAYELLRHNWVTERIDQLESDIAVSDEITVDGIVTGLS